MRTTLHCHCSASGGYSARVQIRGKQRKQDEWMEQAPTGSGAERRLRGDHDDSVQSAEVVDGLQLH